MRKLWRTLIEWDRGRGIGELQGENPGRTMKTGIECKINDDVPESGHHHNLRLNFCITEHGWIGAGGGPVKAGGGLVGGRVRQVPHRRKPPTSTASRLGSHHGRAQNGHSWGYNDAFWEELTATHRLTIHNFEEATRSGLNANATPSSTLP